MGIFASAWRHTDPGGQGDGGAQDLNTPTHTPAMSGRVNVSGEDRSGLSRVTKLAAEVVWNGK